MPRNSIDKDRRPKTKWSAYIHTEDLETIGKFYPQVGTSFVVRKLVANFAKSLRERDAEFKIQLNSKEFEKEIEVPDVG